MTTKHGKCGVGFYPIFIGMGRFLRSGTNRMISILILSGYNKGENVGNMLATEPKKEAAGKPATP